MPTAPRPLHTNRQQCVLEEKSMTAMRYALLGRSGLKVSELCLGTMTFGAEWGWGADKDGCRAIFDSFVNAGGNFFDTANLYTGGSSERLLGDFVSTDRDAAVLATKYTNALPGARDPNAAGNQRKNMVQSLEASLKRLGTDRIDLFWVHAWDFLTSCEDVMRGLDDLVHQGKVLHVGISNAPAWVIARCNTLAELRAWTPFVALQIEYSLIERTVERELIPMARAFDLAVMAWSPLASGILTGKYATTGAENEKRRLDKTRMRAQGVERDTEIVRMVATVGAELDASPGQVALAWVRAKGVLPILGARTLRQIEDNLGCIDLRLSGEQIARLDDISKTPLGFPHDFLTQSQTVTYGGFADRIDGGTPS
jgi:aryl-alcohol dehydrogenase-like predicted oxidoreductase